MTVFAEKMRMQMKDKINARVQKRYDELMAEGRHGHYETMFKVACEERVGAYHRGQDSMRERAAEMAFDYLDSIGHCGGARHLRANILAIEIEKPATRGL